MAPPGGGAADGAGRTLRDVVGRGSAGLGPRAARRQRSRRRVHAGTAPQRATLRLSESVVPSSVKAALTDGQGRTAALQGVHVQTTPTGQSGLIVGPGDKRAPATSSWSSRHWPQMCTGSPGAACPPTTSTPRAGSSCSASSGTSRVSRDRSTTPCPARSRSCCDGGSSSASALAAGVSRWGRGRERSRPAGSADGCAAWRSCPRQRRSSSSRRSSRCRPPARAGHCLC